MDLNAGVEGEEPGLYHRRDLRGVLQMQNDERRPLPMIIREIHRFRLQVCQDGLDRSTQFAGLCGGVTRLNRNISFQ
jgi:hypothetical protein